MAFNAKPLWVALAVSLLSAGCAPSGKDGNSTTACPAAVWPTFHEAFIETRGAIPDKVAVILDGKLKYNECVIRPMAQAAPSDMNEPPIVTVQREKGGLRVLVRHFGAYRELPQDFDFEVQDLIGCARAGKVFFAASNVALDFKKDYPNGPQCGSRTYAKVVLKR